MTIEHRQHARCACGSAFSSFGAGAARPFTLAGTKRVYERARPFTIAHIALDLTLDTENKAFSGTATLDLARVDPVATEIVLDAVGFDIASVTIADQAHKAKKKDAFTPAAHVYDGESLRVTIPAEVSAAQIRVEYRAVPRRGLYFLAPDEHVTDRPRQVWTQCQDEDARCIFPCHDKPHIKQTTELRVKVPKGWYALSNGEIVEEREDGVFHWKMNEPHPSYLFTLVAGEFARIDDEPVDGVPVSYLVPKGREGDAKRTFGRTPAMMRRFGELFGVKYPWNKYAQVVVSDFIFGGMENTTATTMYEHVMLDERAALDISSDDIIAHELAHQWFGDLVTCRDWSHAWLNEGFATFMEHVDRESHKGRDEYDYSLKGDMESYVSEARGRYKRPIVCQDYDAPIDIFDRHLYEKGGLVLHMLRRELGDALFFRGVGAYLEKHRKSVVETRDLMRALEEISGRSLERFFEQWVHRPGHPELEIKIEHDGEVTTVSVKQTQDRSPVGHGPQASSPDHVTPLFAFDLAFDFVFDKETRREVRHVDQASQTFSFRVPARPRFVVVDPEMAVLAEVKIEAPADMLRAQLASAPTARGRMLATPGLGRLDDPPSARALTESLANEKEFWGVRAEAAEALGNLRSEAAFAALEANLGTKHPKVRRAVVHALGSFRTAKSAELLKKPALRDASYLVEAEAARALGATRQGSVLETLVDIVDRPSWGDVIRAGALDGLANLRDERAVPHVVARTRYGVSIRGRRAAIMALPKLANDKKARETLEDLLDSPDPYVRVDVVRALAEIGDAKSRGPLHRQLDRELDGRVRRRIREAIRDLGGAGKREADRLRDELEALRNENAEIKSRLGKLEALTSPQPKSTKDRGRKK
ncbi:Aminopeptidase [Minicystis rosea]|nr:Aminopeptidase [Minicystis rosea]